MDESILHISFDKKMNATFFSRIYSALVNLPINLS